MTAFHPELLNRIDEHLSKILDHPLNDKALKIYNTLALPHYYYAEFLFLTAQSIAFFEKAM